MTAPYTVKQRTILNRTPTWRAALNDIRMSVDKLHSQVTKLQKQNDSLAAQAQRLRDIEAPFIKMIEEQGHTVNDIRILARENRSVLLEMEKLTETEVIQQIISTIMTADESMDCVLSEEETQILIFRLQNLPGIVADEAEIRETVAEASSKNISALFKIAAKLMGKEEHDLSLKKKNLEMLTSRDLEQSTP